jgi:hypothetical protein
MVPINVRNAITPVRSESTLSLSLFDIDISVNVIRGYQHHKLTITTLKLQALSRIHDSLKPQLPRA